jgi:glutaredoxin
MSKEVIVYSTKLCGDCQQLKSFLDAHGIEYIERDINENEAWAKELEERTGKRGVPYCVIDGEWVCGYVPREGFTEEHARKVFGLN